MITPEELFAEKIDRHAGREIAYVLSCVDNIARAEHISDAEAREQILVVLAALDIVIARRSW